MFSNTGIKELDKLAINNKLNVGYVRGIGGFRFVFYAYAYMSFLDDKRVSILTDEITQEEIDNMLLSLHSSKAYGVPVSDLAIASNDLTGHQHMVLENVKKDLKSYGSISVGLNLNADVIIVHNFSYLQLVTGEMDLVIINPENGDTDITLSKSAESFSIKAGDAEIELEYDLPTCRFEKLDPTRKAIEHSTFVHLYDVLNDKNFSNTDTFSDDVKNSLNHDTLNKMSGVELTEKDFVSLIGRIHSVWNNEFLDKKLWTWCAGSLIFAAPWQVSAKNVIRLVNRLIDVIADFLDTREEKEIQYICGTYKSGKTTRAIEDYLIPSVSKGRSVMYINNEETSVYIRNRFKLEKTDKLCMIEDVPEIIGNYDLYIVDGNVVKLDKLISHAQSIGADVIITKTVE